MKKITHFFKILLLPVLILISKFGMAAHHHENFDYFFSPEIQWKNEENQSVSFKQWENHSISIIMAYTSCRTSCPLLIRRLRELQDQVQNKNQISDFIFVTLDPRIDTPKRLKQFKQNWNLNNQWHFLTGTKELTQKLSRALGIKYHETGGHIVHDSKIFLISKDQKISEIQI